MAETKLIRPPYFSQEHQSWVIALTRDVVTLVDEDIAATLGRENWQASSNKDKMWYAARSAKGPPRRFIQMHRVIMDCPDDKDVDHEHHYPFDQRIIDNRRANLRICSTMENTRNRKRRDDARSPYKGLSKHSKCIGWVAAIRHEGRSHYLGYFLDPLEGALAYDRAALAIHGEFAATNQSLGLLPNR